MASFILDTLYVAWNPGVPREKDFKNECHIISAKNSKTDPILF